MRLLDRVIAPLSLILQPLAENVCRGLDAFWIYFAMIWHDSSFNGDPSRLNCRIPSGIKLKDLTTPAPEKDELIKHSCSYSWCALAFKIAMKSSSLTPELKFCIIFTLSGDFLSGSITFFRALVSNGYSPDRKIWEIFPSSVRFNVSSRFSGFKSPISGRFDML